MADTEDAGSNIEYTEETASESSEETSLSSEESTYSSPCCREHKEEWDALKEYEEELRVQQMYAMMGFVLDMDVDIFYFIYLQTKEKYERCLERFNNHECRPKKRSSRIPRTIVIFKDESNVESTREPVENNKRQHASEPAEEAVGGEEAGPTKRARTANDDTV
jgi:hypothetical protein